MIITGDDDLRAEATGETGETTSQQQGRQRYAMGEQLTVHQRETINGLLDSYPDVFTETPGCTHLIQHEIKVTDENPSYQQSYRIPEGMRDAVEQELLTMEKNGIIQYDPNAKWNSPLIIIKKPDGRIRLVNNFIRLNAKTINEQYTMSRPEELVNRVAGSKYISRIDLRSAYWQCLLSPESQKYTAFETPFGKYSYCRMAMGLKCSSATCQRLIDRVLKGAHRYACSLIDDILIHSMDFDTHVRHVTDVLNRLRAAGLTANESKCIFATNSITIFGHEVIDGRIYPDKQKTATVAAWPIPKTKSQLRSFIGLTNYFRAYIERYAAKAYPLTQLLAKYKPTNLKWGPEQQKAFDEMKTALTSRPVLRPPQMDKEMILMADAAKTTVSAILMQCGDSPNEPNRVIAYASRQLLKREQNYATIEKELLALVFGLIKFRYYIQSRPVRLLTDHRPLEWLNSLMKHSARLARWILVIQEFDIKTEYIRGDKQLADALTRRE